MRVCILKYLVVDMILLKQWICICSAAGVSQEQFGADTSNIILNEAAVKVMNLKNPVGKTVQSVCHADAGNRRGKRFSF